jgi:hypothetical protein
MPVPITTAATPTITASQLTIEIGKCQSNQVEEQSMDIFWVTTTTNNRKPDLTSPSILISLTACIVSFLYNITDVFNQVDYSVAIF